MIRPSSFFVCKVEHPKILVPSLVIFIHIEGTPSYTPQGQCNRARDPPPKQGLLFWGNPPKKICVLVTGWLEPLDNPDPLKDPKKFPDSFS